MSIDAEYLKQHPLEISTLIKPKVKKYIKACMELGMTRAQAKSEYNRDPEAVYSNSEYVVLVYKNEGHGFHKSIKIWHLSIRRRDRAPLHDWRVFQEIKNQICGENKEALELYPREDRVVDAANQYHLFAIMTDHFIPLGFDKGMKSDAAFLDSKQRSFK